MEELYDMALAENGSDILRRQLSPIHGHGLFTTEDVPAKTILCRRLGLRSALSARDKRAIIGVDGVDPAEPDDSIFKNINHSCYPNSMITETGCLVNMQELVSGAEITIDYNVLLTGSDWQTPCFCGYPGCTGTIKSIDLTSNF